MKTLKSIFLIGFIFFVNYLFAQTYTYTASPTIGSYHPTCPSGDCAGWTGNTVDMKVTEVTSTYIKFTIKKCDGSVFTSNGTVYIGSDVDMDCANPQNSYAWSFSITSGSTSYNYTASCNWNYNSYNLLGVYKNTVGSLYDAGSFYIYRTLNPPSTPTGLSANPQSSSSIFLSWSSSSGATSYDVYDCSGSYIANTSNTSYTVTGLSSGAYYSYKVRANNSGGSSSFTSCSGATTLSNPTKVISLSGNLNFGNVTVGQSANATLTISNSGNTALYVSSISCPSGFNGNWSGNISAGSNQNVTITFSPTSAIPYSGSITVNSDATSGVNTISCSGTGTAVPTKIINLSGSLSFGSVTIGQSANAILTISNSGNTTLSVSSVTCPSGFSGNWSGNIAAGSSQNVTITFSPTSAITYSGSITVNSDATSGVNTISCSGTGTVAPTKIINLSGNLNFGSITVGQSANATLTISNSGNTTLSISSLSCSSGYSGNWSGNIAAGNSQNVTITFSPISAMNYNGSITVNSDATSGVNTINCSGTGTVVPTKIISLSGSLSFGSVTIGQTANATLTISNSGNTTLSVSSLSCPTGFSGTWSGNISAGNSQNVTITFSPTSAITYSGAITVNSDATSGVNTISCSGTGINNYNVSVNNITGGDVVVCNSDGLFSLSRNIIWSSNISGGTVAIDLIHNGTYEFTIASAQSNNGTYTWGNISLSNLASLPTIDNTYQIRITHSNGTSGICSSNFTIQKVNCSASTVCVTPLYLKFPVDNAVGMPQSITLEWENYPITNVVYELEVTDQGGSIIYSNSSLTSTSYSFTVGTLIYNNIYHWKVRAILNGSPISDWSTMRQFTIKGSSPNSPAYGSALGHFNNAVIYKNYNDYSGNWQCVEFVKRYHNVVYSLYWPGIGNADAYYWGNLGFGRFSNNGSEIPKVGDIICLSGGSNGHVAIVKSVTFSNDNINNDFIIVAQQNVGSNISNHLGQQVVLVYNNGAYYVSNFAGKTVDGWRRAVPTVISPYNNQILTTTEPLIDWENHSGAQNYKIFASKLDQSTGCYEPILNFNGATVYNHYYIFPPNILQAGEKYRIRVGVTPAYGGYVSTEPIYFEISSFATSMPPIINNTFIQTQASTGNKTLPSNISHVFIKYKIDGIYYDKGFTNENGILFVENTPALEAGDTIIASATGLITEQIEVTQEMIQNNNINIVLQSEVTNNIINPSVQILNYTPIYTQNIVNLKITAKNHTEYQILNTANLTDTTSDFISYQITDSLINFMLVDTGVNEIFVRFIGIDTVVIVKAVTYYPNPTSNNFNIVTIISDNSAINSGIYINGIFVKYITSAIETVVVPLGLQNFTFIKNNNISFFANTDTTETIYLMLNPLNVNTITNNEKVNLYPNPVKEELTIETSFPTKQSFEISNMLGQLLYSSIVDKKAIVNTENLPAGIYLIKFNNGETTVTKKFVKQ